MKLFGRALTSCLVIIGVAPVLGYTEKPTIHDFRVSISDHRQRVLEATQRIFAGKSSYFPTLDALSPEISRYLIDVYVYLHDLPKVMTKQQLAKLGYTESQTLLRSLYEVYGQHLLTRPPFIQALNDLEDRLKAEIMKKHLASIDPSLHFGIWQDLKLLERVADVTDTKVHRGRELQFIFRPFGAEEFLLQNGESVAAYLSHWYEATYKLSPKVICRNTHSS